MALAPPGDAFTLWATALRIASSMADTRPRVLSVGCLLRFFLGCFSRACLIIEAIVRDRAMELTAAALPLMDFLVATCVTTLEIKRTKGLALNLRPAGAARPAGALPTACVMELEINRTSLAVLMACARGVGGVALN